MASPGTSKILVEDDPSEVVRMTRKQFNALVDLVVAIVTAAEDAADGDAFRLALEDVDTTTVSKVIMSRERPPTPAI